MTISGSSNVSTSLGFSPGHSVTIGNAPKHAEFIQGLKFGASEYSTRIFNIMWIINQAFSTVRILRESHSGTDGTAVYEHTVHFESCEVRDMFLWLLNKEILAYSQTQAFVNGQMQYKIEVIFDQFKISAEGNTPEELRNEFYTYLKIFFKRSK